jgi:hypothetical protein
MMDRKDRMDTKIRYPGDCGDRQGLWRRRDEVKTMGKAVGLSIRFQKDIGN